MNLRQEMTGNSSESVHEGAEEKTSVDIRSVEHAKHKPMVKELNRTATLCKYCERFVGVQSLHVILVDAARFGHDNCVRALLREGADVNNVAEKKINAFRCTIKETAVLVAAENGHFSCLRILMEAGADVNPWEPGAMLYRSDWEKVLSRTRWDTLLSRATSSGHVSCVELLVQAGADVNNEVLHFTAKKGNDKCLQIFIRAGADVNSIEGAKAVEDAAKERHDKCLDLLLQAGANVNGDKGARALLFAAESGHDKCINLLLNAGADAHSEGMMFSRGKKETGMMALGIAARQRHVQCVHLFIAAGADVIRRDTYGFTALLYAAENGLDTCVNRIFRSGADVNVTDLNGNTALQVMFIQERWLIFPQCIRALLSAGVHVNRVNNREESAIKQWLSGYPLMGLISLITKAGDRFEEIINQDAYYIGYSYIYPQRERRELESVKLLFAAGENIESAPEKVKKKVIPQDNPCLSHLCRDVIREHLLELDPHENLFVRVPRLNLSEELQKFLLFNMSTDEQDKN